jgi:hypothetical protein
MSSALSLPHLCTFCPSAWNFPSPFSANSFSKSSTPSQFPFYLPIELTCHIL